MTDPIRRKLLQHTGMTLVALPLLLSGRSACASVNAPLRSQLNYQATPKDGMSCVSCLEFVPGKTETAAGGCKVIPGDDEILPSAYCTAWNTM